MVSAQYNYTLSADEKYKLLQTNAQTAYKFKGHSFTPLKGIGKQYCKGCGLVALRNDISAWCIDKGCNYSDSPHYPAALKRLTKMRKI